MYAHEKRKQALSNAAMPTFKYLYLIYLNESTNITLERIMKGMR